MNVGERWLFRFSFSGLAITSVITDSVVGAIILVALAVARAGGI